MPGYARTHCSQSKTVCMARSRRAPSVGSLPDLLIDCFGGLALAATVMEGVGKVLEGGYNAYTASGDAAARAVPSKDQMSQVPHLHAFFIHVHAHVCTHGPSRAMNTSLLCLHVWSQFSVHATICISVHMQVLGTHVCQHVWHTCVHTCLCTFAHISAHLSAQMSAHVSAHVSAHMPAHMPAHMSAHIVALGMSADISVRMSVCTHVCTHICTHVCTHVSMVVK